MNATLGRHVLYALIACSLAGPAYPADPGASGAENGQLSDAIQRREPAGVAENAKRDAARRDGSIKSTETTTRGSNARNSSARNGQQAAALHGAGPIPHRSAGPLLGTHANVSKPAVATATRGYLVRRPDADHPASRSDPVTGAARGISATTASAAAGRQSSEVLRALSRPPASLKALAGNGVIGGPRAPGRGMVGGPANSRAVIKASIDGTALHPRL